MRKKLVGLILALAAFSLWGSYPLLWSLLQRQGARPFEILAHRTVWAHALGLLALSGVRGARPDWRLLPRDGRTWAVCFASGALNMGNWLICIWAATSGHLIETSLGYFLAPLLAAGLGVITFGERLGRVQWFAIGLAVTTFIAACVVSHTVPKVALAAAATAAGYAATRKRVQPFALTGMVIETSLFVPLAAGYLIWLGVGNGGVFGRTALGTASCLLAGLVTALAIMGYAGAATRLRLSTLGILQYIYPCAQFVLGVVVFHEPLTPANVLLLAGILASLLLYSWATARSALHAAATAATPERSDETPTYRRCA